MADFRERMQKLFGQPTEPRPKEKEPFRTFLARAGQSDDRLGNRQEDRKIKTNLYWSGMKREGE